MLEQQSNHVHNGVEYEHYIDYVVRIPERFKQFAQLWTDGNNGESCWAIKTLKEVCIVIYVGNKYEIFVGENDGQSSIFTPSGTRHYFDYTEYDPSGTGSAARRVQAAIQHMPTFEEALLPLDGNVAIVQMPAEFDEDPNIGSYTYQYAHLANTLMYYSGTIVDGKAHVSAYDQDYTKTFAIPVEKLTVWKQWYRDNENIASYPISAIMSQTMADNLLTSRCIIQGEHARIAWYRTSRNPICTSLRAGNDIPMQPINHSYYYFVNKRISFNIADVELDKNMLTLTTAYFRDHMDKYETVKAMARLYQIQSFTVGEFLSMETHVIVESFARIFAFEQEQYEAKLQGIMSNLDYKQLIVSALSRPTIVTYMRNLETKNKELERYIAENNVVIAQNIGQIRAYTQQLAEVDGHIAIANSDEKVDKIKAIFNNPQFKFKGQDNKKLYFIINPSQSFNGKVIDNGQMVVILDFAGSTVKKFITVKRYLNNRAGDYWHTHIGSSGNICWGDSLAFVEKKFSEGDFATILNLLLSLLNSHSASNPYIGFETLYALPIDITDGNKEYWDKHFKLINEEDRSSDDDESDSPDLEEDTNEGESNEDE